MNQSGYGARTPEFYLNTIEPDLLASFSPKQLEAITAALETAMLQSAPKPAPKIVDLRVGLDLVFSRFYVVLLVGKDRRKQRRQYFSERVARVGNAIAAALLLLSINLLISLFILLLAYLVKSALGIDLFSHEHLGDQIEKL